MKYRYSIWALSLAALASCTPVQDIYDEIDAENAQNVKSKEEYVLTEADYASISKAAEKAASTDDEKALAKAVKTELALNEFATADKFVPAIIASQFASWGDGSSVGVTYNVRGEQTELEKKYASIGSYTVSAADYASLWGADSPVKFFAPSHSADASIPAILKNKVSDVQADNLLVVNYKADEKDPSYTGEVEMSESFSSDNLPEGWKTYAAEGSANDWTSSAQYSNATITAYNKGEVDSYLVSKAVNVASADTKFAFDLQYAYWNYDCLDVLVSTEYDGTTMDASKWTSIFKDMTNYEAGSSTAFKSYTTLSYNLGAYKGKNVYFAFHYVGSKEQSHTTTVRVKNVTVSNLVLSSNEKSYNALYRFNGTEWKKEALEDAVLVSPAQYDAMGGNIAKNDNFSSSLPAENYVPQLLKIEMPYAQEGDETAVIYNYYDSSSKKTTVVAKQYNYAAGAWAVNSGFEVKEKQTFLRGNGQWVFDPTVVVAVTKDMYQYLVDKVTEEHPAYLDSKYPSNTEYWYGGASYYQNFNITLVKRRSNDPDGKLTGLSDEEAKTYVINMMAEGCKEILAHYYPDAPTESNGIQQKYKVVATAYDGSYYTYYITFKSLGKGQFELDSIESELK